ncbi:uncharacterized protein si:ch73-345f18.3 isoform X2 [Conger conger]|uniref:uncharacterized protein si:ch73-345f18.3 isoform X2 n=1 Tax=Conger conger TaxID=82655 RepID=UPI002A598475|nr:uncharacterized protein si:ch73-345f18.3 isoform X2 [Conger conger]
MSFLFCCCSSCLSTDEYARSSEERQPLLQAESARLFRAPAQEAKQKGKILAKLVGISELDQHFADVADTFNQQQEHYETMIETWRLLRDSYGCSHRNGLSDCLQRMREEHSGAQLGLQMRGYDLSLAVAGPLGARLQQAQEQVGVLGQAAKAVVAAGPRLQGMMGWVLQQEDQLLQRVREASPSYPEQLRVQANLRENLQTLRQAGDLSVRYRREAGALLTEAAALTAGS